MNQFSNYNLIPSLQKTLSDLNYKSTTEIQAKTLPDLLQDESLVGVAETGTGKTLAYVLPILNKLKKLEMEKHFVKKASHPRAVVIVPTRELGEQVAKVFKNFTHETRLRVRSVLGGTDIEVAKKNIGGDFEILVATPGRLVKMLKKRDVIFKDVRTLVFDEADQLMDQGFFQDASYIAKCCPESKQFIMFTATLSQSVKKLIADVFPKINVIQEEKTHQVVPQLKTENWEIPFGEKLSYLKKFLFKNKKGSTLVFTNTREQCDALAELLTKEKIECLIYRGEMDKKLRRQNLNKFKEGKVKMLVSTDLGSRGLDIEHVEHIINYNMPKNYDNYIHRVGRTARAGRSGKVINFITKRDKSLLEKFKLTEAKKEK